MKDQYFARTLQWNWLDDKMIHLFDHREGRMVTMDEWPQLVYLDADGQRTVDEYIHYMADQYESGNIPEELDKAIIDVIQSLIDDGGLVALSDQKITLKYYIDQPKSEQDIDKAYEMMIADGYLKEEEE